MADRQPLGLLRGMLLVWLVGISLRIPILAVPPLLPRIHHDLQLDEKAVGALSSLPVLLLSVASVFGSLLIARLGARRATIAGLLLVAGAGAVRGSGTATAVLFTATLLMGIGIAVGQPALPSISRQWFPGNTARATAVFANGFLVGEVVAAAFTVPFVLPLAGGSWQRALALWSIPIALIAGAIATGTPHENPHPDAPPARWWPDWRSGVTWRLGLILGSASLAYFGCNAFIPDYLRATHHAAYIPAALTSLSVGQLPASFIAAAIPHRLVARRWPLAAVGVLTIVSAAGMALGGIWVPIWAAPLGFSTAVVFILILALPPLIAPGDVHRLSAATFTIAYACAFFGSFLGGAIWDLTGVPLTAFAPVLASGAAMGLLVIGLNLTPAGAAMRRASGASAGD